jgi:hypothetical protein
LLRNPATEQEVAARIGIAPVASWFIAQAVPFRIKAGQVASVEPQRAYINLGANDGLEAGNIVDVLRNDGGVHDPISGDLLGTQQSSRPSRGN